MIKEDTQGMRLSRKMIDQGQYIFSIDQAQGVAASIGIPEAQIKKILSNLTRKGWLVRLRRGLYAGTGTLPGMIQVHPFAIATHLVEPSAISHWSAMQHHGLTEQISQVIMAVTPKKITTPSMRLPLKKSKSKHKLEVMGIFYEYVTIQSKHFFGIEEVWVDEYFRVPITDKERTILDGFIYPKMFGGMGAIFEVFEANQHNIEIIKLVDYAIRYGKKAVVKRLGWSLEYFGVEEKLLQPLLIFPVSSYSLLDPTRPAKGPCNSRWMIQDNLTG